MSKEGEDFRTTDQIILDEIRSLKEDFQKLSLVIGEIKTEIAVMKEQQSALREVTKVLTSPNFQRLIIDAERISDQEEMLRIVGDEYEGVNGFSLLPRIMRHMARFFKRKNMIEDNLFKKISFGFLDFFVKIIPQIVVFTFIIIIIIIIAASKNNNFYEIIKLLYGGK
jgi:hypothetical protein